MAKAKKENSPHGTGICQLGYKLILAGQTNEKVLAAILKKFPEANTKMTSVAWMRNKLRKEGKKVKTQGELKLKAA